MKQLGAIAVVIVGCATSIGWAGQKEDLLGKWELTEASAGMPKGTIWDFQKGGALVVSAKINDKSVTVNIKYELKDKILHLELDGGKKDTTGLEKLTKTELVFKDRDGTLAKFKRAK
jgi:uncharacterized protein (TIGR03066 family)